eukprot:3727742-Rhodomonas_salina.1
MTAAALAMSARGVRCTAKSRTETRTPGTHCSEQNHLHTVQSAHARASVDSRVARHSRHVQRDDKVLWQADGSSQARQSAYSQSFLYFSCHSSVAPVLQ